MRAGELCPPTFDVSDACIGSDEVDLDRDTKGRGHLIARGHHGVPAEPANNVKLVPSRSSGDARAVALHPCVRHAGSGFPAQFLGVNELHGIGVGGSGLVGHDRSGAVLVTGNHVKQGPFFLGGQCRPVVS